MKNLYIFLLLMAGLVGFGQKDLPSPDGSSRLFFDTTFDRFGNNYNLKDLVIDDKKLQRAVSAPIFCNSGIFNIYFETGSGMEGTSTLNVNRRNVICQVFNDLSNFINTPLKNAGNIAKVNILVRNINAIANVPFNVLGLSSGFYTLPNNTDANFGGIADNEIWKTIQGGKDSYTNLINSFAVNNTTPSANGSFYHGIMAFNFRVDVNNNPIYNWNINLNTLAPIGSYDLYSVALHEVTHALGFASLINNAGLPQFGVGYNYFSRYDLFLKNSSNSFNLITNNIQNSCSTMYNNSYNTNVPITAIQPDTVGCVFNQTTCSNAIKFVGTNTTPVYTPNCYEQGSSLSHFEDSCVPPNINDAYFVMSNAISDGALLNSVNTKRFLRTEERTALNDLGYSLNGTYGNNTAVVNSFINYGQILQGANVAGIHDGLIASGINIGNFSFIGNASIAIPIANVLLNDTNATAFECLEDVFDSATTLNGLQRLSGTAVTNISFFSSNPGLHILRYIPLNNLGQKGNITYVYVYVNPSNCGLPNSCDLVLNGNFEQISSLPDNQDQLNRSCGWSSAHGISASPDFYHSDSTVQNFKLICNSFGTEPDNIIGGKAYAGLYIGPNPDALGGAYCENILTKLNNPLLPNTTYQLSFDLSLAENCSASKTRFQAYLSNSIISQIYPRSTIPIANPNMLFTSPTFNNTAQGWERVNFTFTTGNVSGEQYLYLGGLANLSYTANPPQIPFGCGFSPFLNSRIGLTYYFIDNVSIKQTNGTTFQLPNVICENTTLQNLETYLTVAKPGGIFIGNGVVNNNGVFSFVASSSNFGLNTIIYRFTNQNGCVVDISSTITVNPINLTPVFNIASVCANRQFSLPTVSNNGITGSWLPATFNNSATANYTFTPLGNCNNSPISVTITVNPFVLANFTQVAPICSGSILFPLPTTSNNGISGTWSPAIDNINTRNYIFNPSPGQCINYSIPIQMTIVVLPATDPICSNTSCQPNLTLTVPETNTTKNYKYLNWIKTMTNYSVTSGKVINFQAQDYISWLPNTYFYSGSTVTAKIETCVVTSSRASIQNDTNNKLLYFADLKIYPNPTNDVINIFSENEKLSKIMIASIEGKLIFEQKLDNENSFQFDLSNFTDGMYILSIETEEGKTTIKKLIKE